MTLAMGMGAVELRAQEPKPAAKAGDAPAGPPVNCAIIGLGARGKEMLESLAKMGAASAPVVAICDTYTAPVFMKKAQEVVPAAKFYDDYKKVLDDKTVQAVFVATPSHKHKQIVLDALQAGKHVYCEAPLATDLDEAKVIAQAALAAKPLFQAGLQARANGQNRHVRKFVQSDAIGKLASGRGQFHKKGAWKRVAPTDERQRELNWRLHKDTSSGLAGEEGIYLIDTASWYVKQKPVSVTGFGSRVAYNGGEEGMEIPNVVQVVVEYPDNFLFNCDLALVNSFDDIFETFVGDLGAILLRDQRAWMFKEPDAPLVGWEVFARKDDYSFGNIANGTGVRIGSGIALVADATKQLALGKQPGEVGTDVSSTALYQAMDSFLGSIRKNEKPECDAKEGYNATVVAHKANDAVLSGTKYVFKKEDFDLS